MAETPPLIAPYAGRLRVRVCGICLIREKVLVVQHKATVGNDAFWAPPGGGLGYGEKVTDCLVREVKEETGLGVRAGDFLGVNEFIGDPLHAIELFFGAHYQGGEPQTGHDPEVDLEHQLIEKVHLLSLEALKQLDQANLHPFLRNLSRLEDLLLPRSRFMP
jgi:8-oxo-dGTP diphosphatase